MKRITLFSFLFFTILNIYSVDLVGREFWETETGKYGFFIRFKDNNNFSFSAVIGNDESPIVNGTYTVKNNDVLLNWPDASFGKEYQINKYSIVKIENSLFSEYKLTGNGKELWDRNRPSKGKKIQLNNLILIAFWDGEKVITENARLREGPGTNYNYKTFQIKNPENYWELLTVTSVPLGYSVEVVAHSENKTTIDGIADYWYYCRFNNNIGAQYDAWVYGWIWGGLLKN